MNKLKVFAQLAFIVAYVVVLVLLVADALQYPSR